MKGQAHVMMKKLRPTTEPTTLGNKPVEGQRGLERSNQVVYRCPSAGLSLSQAQKKLQTFGINKKRVEEVSEFLKALITNVIREELQKNDHE